MKIKIFCRCSLFLPGRAKNLSATLYRQALSFILRLTSSTYSLYV